MWRRLCPVAAASSATVTLPAVAWILRQAHSTSAEPRGPARSRAASTWSSIRNRAPQSAHPASRSASPLARAPSNSSGSTQELAISCMGTSKIVWAARGVSVTCTPWTRPGCSPTAAVVRGPVARHGMEAARVGSSASVSRIGPSKRKTRSTQPLGSSRRRRGAAETTRNP
ncbi:hypothetical protein GCM10010246_21980 [Streptomyces cuspidosporus]|uniref:Secreted protein n=1 Tax=Streptomyces cuspidosporus TaxID=66882 RepID=A0ABN3FTD7_9ACTN